LAIASEAMLGPELRSGAVREVLSDWRLPSLDIAPLRRHGLAPDGTGNGGRRHAVLARGARFRRLSAAESNVGGWAQDLNLETLSDLDCR
jgi:hypothetical protein